MNLNKKNLGFTLIELLVVVAIIGILASVVLASLNTARTKGATAAFKAEASQVRTNIVLLCDGKNSGDALVIPAGSTFDAVTTTCTGNGTASVSITANGTKGGACASAVVTDEVITFTPVTVGDAACS